MQLETVENYTPFVWFAFEKMAPGRSLCDVVVVKAACALLPGREEDGIALLEEEAAPIHLADEHFAAAGESSLAHAGETVILKPGADLFIGGHAQAPAKNKGYWEARVQLWGKDAQGKDFTRVQHWRLLGERQWRWSLMGGWQLSEAAPVERVPLRYERAFGGRYPQREQWIAHEANPVGVGWIEASRMDRHKDYPAAQIEFFSKPVQRLGAVAPVPALGPIPRFWASRAQYAGTYGKQWREAFEAGRPDYPADFDPRFFQAAHPDWIFSPRLEGRERLLLQGLHGDKVCGGRLPGLRLEALLLSRSSPPRPPILAPLRLDTVEIALDQARLYLTWRLTLPQALEIRLAALRMLKEN